MSVTCLHDLRENEAAGYYCKVVVASRIRSVWMTFMKEKTLPDVVTDLSHATVHSSTKRLESSMTFAFCTCSLLPPIRCTSPVTASKRKYGLH
jgi:hypothetical protein